MQLTTLIGILCIIKSINSNSINIKEGGSFVHYIDLDGGDLQKCILKINNEQISLYPNNLQNAVNPVKSKLTSWEKRVCGFKLTNYEPQDPLKYDLTATILKAGQTYSSNKTLKLIPGSALEIANSTALVQYRGKYEIKFCRLPLDTKGTCALYSPKGILTSTGYAGKCDYTIQDVTKEHVGDWRCEMNFSGDVEPSAEFYHTLILKKVPKVESWYKKQDGYGIIGCTYLNSELSDVMTSCTMTSPEKTILYIEPYSASGRYDSFGTNYTKKTCQIEFKLPAGQNETGTWSCNLLRKRGFINVEQASSYPRTLKVLAKPTESPYINCEVPYAAFTSFAVNPEGAVFYKATMEASQNGILNFPIHSINESDFGEWTCHFSKNDTYDDDIITVNVERSDIIQPKVKEVNIDVGDELILLFTAHRPITYCAIEDPKGNTYHIRPSTKTSYIEYYGTGFEHGECGLKLKHVTEIHNGVWKCMTSTTDATQGEKQPTAMTIVDVRTAEEANLSTASSSSIWIGVIFAVLVTTALIIYARFRKERKERVSPPNSEGDENSERTYVLRHL